jgi:hypothetical protein
MQPERGASHRAVRALHGIASEQHLWRPKQARSEANPGSEYLTDIISLAVAPAQHLVPTWRGTFLA